MGKAKKLEDLMDAFFSTRRNDPIRTQHASAADFDEFSDAHMGSGEGAQFYGKGHYTSQGPKTHDQYTEQARAYPGNELGRLSSGKQAAMKYDVDLHLDPDRILDLDAEVEMEMLDLLQGRGKEVPKRRWNQRPQADQDAFKRLRDAEMQQELHGFPDHGPVVEELDAADQAMDSLLGNVWADYDEYKRDAFHDFKRMNEPEGGFDKDKFLRDIQRHTKGDKPINKELVNYLDLEVGNRHNLKGQRLMKEIGIQAYKHDDFGQRIGESGAEDYHNYITLYPELMEIVKKEKGNITLPMLATLASAGAALPPAATKLLKQREKKLANELFGGVLTGAASGAVGGLADILDWVSGRSSPNPDLGIAIAGKGADKLEDIQGSILKWADEQGWNDKGAQTLGELIAPGL